LNGRALQAIEFPRVVELLVARAASGEGKTRASRLGPLADPAEAAAVVEAVGELIALQVGQPGWRAVAFPDVRASLAAARAEGSVLDAGALAEVAQLLRRSAAVIAFFAGEEQRAARPRTGEIAGALFTDRQFPETVDRTFEPSGEVRDAASPRLRELRVEHRRAQQRLSDQLEQFSRQFRAGAEESFVTLRGGRYVLSVPVTEKRRAPGIVHDRSASGHTVYLEPFEAVEANNAIAELEADVRQEVHRILAELTRWVRLHAARLEETADALGRLDELDARARLARDLHGSRPALDLEGRTLRVVGARHPLLRLTLGERAVPLDLTLEGGTRGLVVSGPNMGGKTVVLKTVGLVVAMALAGLYVPAADGTVVPWVDRLFVDIGDEQSLESDLSTYAARLRHMQAMLEAATERSLVLIDELGAGTDPEEGAALGRGLLEEIGRRGAFCVVSTHHGAFKAFAAETAGYANAAMAYDAHTLRPTYRLQVGLPGRSHAFELARREGWPAHVLADAERFVSEGTLRTETLLRQIDEKRQSVEGLEAALRAERAAAEAERERLAHLAAGLRRKIDAVRTEKALEEDRRLREVREVLAELRRRLAELPESAAPEEIREIRRTFHDRERRVASLAKSGRPALPPRGGELGPVLAPEQRVPGARAFSRRLGVEVSVLADDADDGSVWVEHRGRRIVLPAGDLHAVAGRAEPAGPAAPPRPVTVRSGPEAAAQEAVPVELDLRGLTAAECLERLDLYLDRALLAGLHRVRLIHGKGQGILRREVQRFLESHPGVSRFRDGEPGEGGWGVTMAFLGPEEPGTRPRDGSD
jgi:DNA mismatch repair protein MutS2